MFKSIALVVIGFLLGLLSAHLFTCSASPSGTYSISGRILDENGDPVCASIFRVTRPIDILLHVKSTERIGASDPAGYFLIPELASGTHNISIEHQINDCHFSIFQRPIYIGNDNVDLGVIKTNISKALANLPPELRPKRTRVKRTVLVDQSEATTEHSFYDNVWYINANGSDTTQMVDFSTAIEKTLYPKLHNQGIEQDLEQPERIESRVVEE